MDNGAISVMMVILAMNPMMELMLYAITLVGVELFTILLVSMTGNVHV